MNTPAWPAKENDRSGMGKRFVRVMRFQGVVVLALFALGDEDGCTFRAQQAQMAVDGGLLQFGY